MNKLANYIIDNFDRIKCRQLSYSNVLYIDSFIDFFNKEISRDLKISNNQKRIFTNSKVHQINSLMTSTKLRYTFDYLIRIIESFSAQSIHIHINDDLTDAEIESLKIYFSFYVFKIGFYDSDKLKEELSRLKLFPAELKLPMGSGMALNKIERNHYGRRHKTRLLEFLINTIDGTSSDGFLLNLNRLNEKEIFFSEFSDFPNSTNCLINFGKDIQSIFEELFDVRINSNPLEKFTTIINLFPVIYGPNIWYNSFQKENLNEWNSRVEGCDFRKIITITSKEESYETLIKMKKENKLKVDELYIIFPFELV